MTTVQIVGSLIGCGFAYVLWVLKRYQTKVDELDNRVTRIETIVGLLGDIKEEIGDIKIDIAVIKNNLKD